MIHSKNKAGFTLIEVLIAVFIVGIVLVPILSNQATLFRTASRAGRQLAYIFFAKQFLNDQNLLLASGQTIAATTKRITQPKTTLTYEQKKIPENSSLKKFKNSELQSVSWTDELDRKKRKDKLVSIVFSPQKAETKS